MSTLPGIAQYLLQLPPQAVAVALEDGDLGVVDEPVGHCRDRHEVAEAGMTRLGQIGLPGPPVRGAATAERMVVSYGDGEDDRVPAT